MVSACSPRPLTGPCGTSYCCPRSALQNKSRHDPCLFRITDGGDLQRWGRTVYVPGADRECFPMSEYEEYEQEFGQTSYEDGLQSSSPLPSRRQSLLSFQSMSVRRNMAGCCNHRKSRQTGAFREDQDRMCWMPLFIGQRTAPHHPRKMNHFLWENLTVGH